MLPCCDRSPCPRRNKDREKYYFPAKNGLANVASIAIDTGAKFIARNRGESS